MSNYYLKLIIKIYNNVSVDPCDSKALNPNHFLLGTTSSGKLILLGGITL